MNPNEPRPSQQVEKEPGVRESGVEQPESVEQRIQRHEYENSSRYLWRAGRAITEELRAKGGLFFDPGRTQEKHLQPEILAAIESIARQAAQPDTELIDHANGTEIVGALRDRVGYHDRGAITDSAAFDTTQRKRKFFDVQPGAGSAKRETYWNTLFFPYNTEATRKLAGEMLHNKTVVLLGGGRSELRGELQAQGIEPAQLVNVDPFVENVEPGADPVIPISASSSAFAETLAAQGITRADEIWAEYSVPAYLDDPVEIQQLIYNIDALLAPEGTARIWPIEVDGKGEDVDRATRAEALVKSIEHIVTGQRYEITLYSAAGREGLLLHKLPPLQSELRQQDDDTRIEEIRSQLG